MAESTDRQVVKEEHSQDATSAAKEWRAPTLTRLGDAVPLTMGATGTAPDGPGLQS
jgi:hypothetical protein